MNHIAISLSDVFFNKKTGRLVFKKDDVAKDFFFQRGTLIHVKTNQLNERLGEILLKMERISKDEHGRMDSYIEPNKSIGEILKDRGVISEQDLTDAVTQQFRETVLNTFPVFDADISFHDHEGFSGDPEEARISIPFLIEYGIRRMRFHPALKFFLSGKIPSVKKKSFLYLLTAEEKDILDRVLGNATAEDLLKTLTSPPEFFWKSLYLFYCLEIIGLEEQGEAGAAEAGPGAEEETPRDDSPPEISEVLSFRETLSSRNYYQILDVPRTAGDKDIKKAYFILARRYHPDRFNRDVAGQYKAEIDEVFDAITNAYRILVNKEKRKAYDSGVGLETHEDFQDFVKKADIKFRQGKTLFSMDRFDEAITFLEEAIRMRKDKGDYYLLLALAESRVPAYVRKAEEDFLQAISLEPWNPEGYVGLGTLYKNEGLQTKAIRQFEKALECDPQHALARRALAEVVPQEKKKGLKALFSVDLFGSKGKKK
jgi:tetratricopeptide (TPR) repeat protein